MAVTCQKCATENSDSAKFCKGCGHDLRAAAVSTATVPNAESSHPCAKCNTENSINAKFCKSCGASMASAPQEGSPPVPTPVAKTVITPAKPAIAPAIELPKEVDAKVKRASSLLWGGMAAICLVLAGIGYWYMRSASTPDIAIAPAAVSPAAATVAPPAPVVPVSAPLPASEPAPVAVPMSAPAPATEQTPKVTPAPAQPAPKPVAPKPAPAIVQKSAPAPAPVTASTPTQTYATAPPLQTPHESGPSSPEEACGKRVFLALTFCIQEQCQTPHFTNHPQCVKFRQQTKDNQNRISN